MLLRVVVVLVVGGAIGNLIDRIIRGYVVDFLDFYIFGYNYPVFNVSDICVVCGAILLLIWVFWTDRKAKKIEEVQK
jgi:signal peptidase II